MKAFEMMIEQVISSAHLDDFIRNHYVAATAAGDACLSVIVTLIDDFKWTVHYFIDKGRHKIISTLSL